MLEAGTHRLRRTLSALVLIASALGTAAARAQDAEPGSHGVYFSVQEAF